MRSAFVLAGLAAALAFADPALASRCRLVETGSAQVTVEEAGARWTYRLVGLDPDWTVVPGPAPGSGVEACRSCPPDHRPFWLQASLDPEASPAGRTEARVEAGETALALLASKVPVGRTVARPVEGTAPMRFGVLAGSLFRYRLVHDFGEIQAELTDAVGAVASDGCVRLSFVIVGGLLGYASNPAELEARAARVAVERVPG